MAIERVVPLKDDKLGEVKLDLNNGYVYDKAGNQIAKWAVSDQQDSGLLADYAATEMHEVLCSALESAECFKASQAEVLRDAARSIRKRGWSGDGHVRGLTDQGPGRQVNMDLGNADVHLPAALPNYAAGYRNAQPIADVYAPPILVDKPSNKYFTFDKLDAFQRAAPTVGATSAQVNEVSPRVANATYTVVEYALGGFVGTQLEAAADAALRLKQATMNRILNALVLEREMRVATKATTSGNWDSTVYTSLGAAAKWNGGVSSDPVKDLHDKMETSWGDISGIIMSEKVFHSFQRNANVLKYYSYKTNTPGLPNAKEIAAILELPPIYVARMKYLNASTALDYVWGSSVVLFRMPAQMPPTSQDDISSAATFRWNGNGVSDGQASNGMIVREFFVQDRGSAGGSKIVLLHQDAEVQTSAFVGGLIAGAYQ